MAKGTPATRALTQAGIAFTLHQYDYDPNSVIVNGGRRGLQVELGVADLVRVLEATAAELCA